MDKLEAFVSSLVEEVDIDVSCVWKLTPTITWARRPYCHFWLKVDDDQWTLLTERKRIDFPEGPRPEEKHRMLIVDFEGVASLGGGTQYQA